jgi:hypothetical protein
VVRTSLKELIGKMIDEVTDWEDVLLKLTPYGEYEIMWRLIN